MTLVNSWLLRGVVWLCAFGGLCLGSGGPAYGDEATDTADVLDWSALPPLPDPHGFAGPFAGVSGDALIVAGGANFPNGPPWDGGIKQWYAGSYVLADPNGDWRTASPLPRPLGYGVSVTWNDRLFCIGGGDAERHYADVVALRWDGDSLRVDSDALPKLPQPVAFAAGILVGDVIYIVGGIDRPDASHAERHLWALDLSRPPPERRWVALPDCPGPGRILPVVGTVAGRVILVSGAELSRSEEGEVTRRYLKDAYEFDPQSKTWRPLADAPRPMVAAPSPAINLGSSHLAFLSGDDGRERPAAETGDRHPGFAPQIFLYHTITDSWRTAGEFPRQTSAPQGSTLPAANLSGTEEERAWRGPPVTTPVVAWRDHYVIPSGEIRPGVRTPSVVWATPAQVPGMFGWINWTVLALYLGSMVGIGCWFSSAEKGTEDYFLGGRRVPWWAAGLSIFGTMLSAITYLSIPARVYATDWSFILMNVGIVAIAPVVIYLYLPFFRRLKITTAFEYLELRFHLSLRLFGSASFVIFQLGRMSIVILLPAMAISAIIGLDIRLCILLMGLLSTFYTVMGGIEAVIWTDVVQVVVLLVGAVAALLTIVFSLDGGVIQLLEIAADHDKFVFAHFSWSWTGDALWIIVLGAIFSNSLIPYTADQAVIQRYLTTPSESQAARAIWTNALLAIPASLLFFMLGTALFAFYHSHPDELRPLASADQILPWFIASQMPRGLSGLVIAGVFAAAMSSLDSSIHSLSTVLTSDFARRFRPTGSDQSFLKLARLLTILLGILGTAVAFGMAQMEVPYLWDLFLGIMGLLGGTLAGLFLAGILFSRVHTPHAWLGVIASISALLITKFYTTANGLLYGAIGVGVCVLVAWLASLVLPTRTPQSNLTIFSMPPRDKES